jgi:hypothetical protein
MNMHIILQVPSTDAVALNKLATDIASDGSTSTVQPFDGEILAQILAALTPTTVPILIAWIRARAASRKSYQVVIDGVQLTGYTPAEVSRIIDRLEMLGSGDEADE